MNFLLIHKIIIILIDVIGTWLVLWVYLSKPKEKINRLFVLMGILMFIWVNFSCIARLVNNVQLSLILIKIAWIATPLFFASLYFFTVFLIQENKKYIFLNRIIFSLGLFFALITEFTDLIIKEIELNNEILSLIYGKGVLFFLISILFIIGATLYVLLKKYFKFSGENKEKIKFFLIGVLIFYISNIIFNVFFPIILGVSRFYYLGDYSLIFLLSFIAYAIIKHRLLDIKVAIGKVVSAILSIATIILTALLISFLNSQLANPLPITIIIPFIALLSVFLFQLSEFYSKITARYLYPTFYQTEIAIADLEKKLTQTLDLESLSFLISDTLTDAFNLQKIIILIKELNEEKYKVQKILGFGRKKIINLIKDPFVLSFLQKNKKPFGREELNLIIEKTEKEEEKQRFQSFKEKIKELEIAVILPLFFDRKIIAIIILGEKMKSESFTVQDVELLKIISYQTSIALKNASLYSEIKKRKEELEKFYRLTVSKELKIDEFKKRIKELENKLRKNKR